MSKLPKRVSFKDSIERAMNARRMLRIHFGQIHMELTAVLVSSASNPKDGAERLEKAKITLKGGVLFPTRIACIYEGKEISSLGICYDEGNSAFVDGYQNSN